MITEYQRLLPGRLNLLLNGILDPEPEDLTGLVAEVACLRELVDTSADALRSRLLTARERNGLLIRRLAQATAACRDARKELIKRNCGSAELFRRLERCGKET